MFSLMTVSRRSAPYCCLNASTTVRLSTFLPSYRVAMRPPMTRSGFNSVITDSIFSIRLSRLFRARYSVWTGMKTFPEATSAFVVISPRLGGQSKRM